MTFNATLGGDNSPTDKMNVKGDTQGNTRVRVDNIGGVGAQTVNGIELLVRPATGANHLDGCERFRPYPERRNAH